MTDDRDTAVVEDRLARAMEHVATSTTISPDAWGRIEERTARRRRRRLVLGGIVAPALAVAAVVALVAVVFPADRGREPQVTAGPAPAAAGRAWYAPGDVEGEYRLLHVQTLSSADVAGQPSPMVVYGRRSADGVAFDGFVAVIRASQEDAEMLRSMSSEADGASPPRQVVLRGMPMSVADFDGGYKVVWDEPGTGPIGVLAYGVAETDVLAAVEGVRVDGGLASTTGVPARFTEVRRTLWPPEPGALAERVTVQEWDHVEDGDRTFTLFVYEDDGASLDSRAWMTPDAHRSEADGRVALYSPEERSLTWVPAPGVLLVLVAQGLTEAEAGSLAGRIEPVDEESWDALVATVPGAARGEREVIARGGTGADAWEAVAYAESVGDTGRPGACLEIERLGGTSGSCYMSGVGATEIVDASPVGSGTPGHGMFIVAALGKDVDSYWVVLADARTVKGRPAVPKADLGMNFLIADVGDTRQAATVIAFDADGEEVDRVAVPAMPAPPNFTGPPTTVPPGAAPPPAPSAVAPPAAAPSQATAVATSAPR